MRQRFACINDLPIKAADRKRSAAPRRLGVAGHRDCLLDATGHGGQRDGAKSRAV